MRIGRLPALLALVILAACDGGSSPATASSSSTSAAPITSTTAAATTTSIPDTLLIPPAGEMAAAWTETLFIPYGEREDMLGTSPGGEGGTLNLGPEYGAQDGGGGWWFLDAAKLRIAHFMGDGGFVEGLPVPADLLTGGAYFQYQMPRVLDDGTFVATGFGVAETRVLLVRAGVVSGTTVPREVGVQTDDGRLLYGHAYDGRAGSVVIDLEAGTTGSTEWFLARNGDRFRITASGDRLRIEMPEASFDHTFDLEAGGVGGAAFVSVEAATGEDGSLHLLLIGVAEGDESVQLAGYLSISGDGAVGPVEAVRDPFSPSDPGSPAHLGVRPGSSDPWLMFVDEDGVRVFTRT